MSFTSPKYHNNIRQVHGKTLVQRDMIRAFLQSAIYCWCMSIMVEPFTTRDLIGGDKSNLQSTPLMTLYEHYLDGDNDNYNYLVSEADKVDVRLLFDVIANDRREFETWESFMQMYR